MKLTNCDILCVGFADWHRNSLWTNQHHLMYRLAQSNRVLFIESLGIRRATFTKRDLQRLTRRLVRGLHPLRYVDGLHVLSPLVLPCHHLPTVRRINRYLLRKQVNKALTKLSMRNPILWAYVPQAEMLLEPLKNQCVVYHCVDDIAAQTGVDSHSFRRSERRFAEQADLVLASSQTLFERIRSLNANTIYAPNVADTQLFQQALTTDYTDPELEHIPEPRVVFVGAIVDTKLDFELIKQLSELRPDWSIVMVGPVGQGSPHTRISDLASKPNIYFLEQRHYTQLPAILRGAAAGIVPYAINELTHSVFPMKIYEYLAAGLPVVTTPLPALEHIPCIHQAPDAPTMARILTELITNDSESNRINRSMEARNHSWDRRILEIETTLDDSYAASQPT